MLRLDLVHFLSQGGSADTVFGHVGHRGVAGQVADAVVALAQDGPLAHKAEDDEILRLGRGRQPLHGLEDVFLGGRLAAALGVGRAPQQKTNMVLGDAKILVVREQIVQGLHIIFSVGPRFDIWVCILTDPNQYYVGPRHGEDLGSLGRTAQGLREKQSSQ